MRRFCIAPLCGALLVNTVMATASCGADTPVVAQNLLVEVWVNGANTSVVAKLIKRDGVWWASLGDLKEAGVNINSGGTDRLVALAGIDGVTSQIDPVEQRLLIEAPPDDLAPQRFDLHPPPTNVQPTSGTGLVSSYSVTGTVGDWNQPSQTSGVDALFGETFFSPIGTVSTTGFSDISNTSSQFVRLDSTAEWDEPGFLRRWIAGDAISGGLPWSRSVRFGGFQIATDFALQPGLTTFPLPAFFGQAAVPGTVDVFVNSARVFETDVAPGPFELHDLPVVTGDGQATVVVRDILGQETTQTFSFYASDSLLREGLSDFDLDAGFLRQLYGEESFRYGEPVATGTYRYGFTDVLTLETHAEGAANLQLLGGGGALGVGAYGVIGADAAISRSASGTGELFAASFASSSRPVGVFGSVAATAGHYDDLAGIGGTAESRLRTQLGANLGLDQDGSVALSWLSIKTDGGAAVQLLTADYTLSIHRDWSFSATGLHDCANGSWAAELNLSIPIGTNLFASASAQTGAGSNAFEAEVTRPANPDGGFGYSLLASAGDMRGATADATWIADHGTLEGAVSDVNGQSAGRLSASGAFIVMNDSVFATRNPQGAIALVETGEADVPVYMDNRLVARSDSDGEALLTNVTANSPNKISIQPTDYAFSTVIDASERIVVPRRQSGVVADLAPPRSRPALLALQFANGDYPPAGAEVRLANDSRPLVLGHDGQVFIADLENRISGSVDFSGGTCRFAVDPPAVVSPDAIPRLGPVLCAKE